MYRLCCDISRFASRSLAEGICVANMLHINDIAISDIGRKTLETCSGAEVEDIRCALIDSNKTIVLLHTQLPLADTAAYNTLFRKAHLLNVKNVRIHLAEQAPNADALSEILRMANAWNIGIVFQNNPQTFFRDDPSMTAFMKGLGGHVAVSFDPAGFVALAKHPFFHVFYGSKLKNRVRFLQLQDTLYSNDEPMPLGGGNSEIKELISILLSRSYDGWFCITPYLDNTPDGMAASVQQYHQLLKTM